MPFATMGHTVLVHAMINHREPVTLLLDTGATRTMLTPDIARRLGMSPAVDAPITLTLDYSARRLQLTPTASGSGPGHERAASGMPLAHTGYCMRPAGWVAPEGCARQDQEAP